MSTMKEKHKIDDKYKKLIEKFCNYLFLCPIFQMVHFKGSF